MFQPDVESAPVEQRRELQLQRLKDLVTHVSTCDAEFWRDRMRGSKRVP